MWPFPSIPSSSEIQQFWAKTGGEKKQKEEINLHSPSCQTWELAEQRVVQWAAGEENGVKKRGNICRKIPPWPVQPHWLSHVNCPAAPFLQHLHAACARAKGCPAAPVFQRHSGKTDLKASSGCSSGYRKYTIQWGAWCLLQPPAHTRHHTTERQLKTVPCQHFYHNTYIFICGRYNFQPENNPILTHSQHRPILLHLSWRGIDLVNPTPHTQHNPCSSSFWFSKGQKVTNEAKRGHLGLCSKPTCF